jgi:putative peptide zinc metalloprotease protein
MERRESSTLSSTTSVPLETEELAPAAVREVPIPWSRRVDLICERRYSDGRPVLGIKDPVRLSYFELSEESSFVFEQLDGQVTVQQLCQRFHERYRPRQLSEEELQRFLGQLVNQGLVVAESFGYGNLLLKRETESQVRRRWRKWTNLLAIRFRGFNPDRFLEGLLSRVGWLFSPWALAAGGLLVVSAITLVAVQFDDLQARLPETQALLTASNLVWLSLLLAIVKVLHELGHGLTCKRFGGECHELGVMLLVFTPTLYCNVSDIWTIRSKWQRIAVSAAGMWVEVLIAAAATLLWWFSQPGLFHTLCLNLMFLCGVSTLVFNGNPLLRYDGYFVLADWLEIPNLQQQAQTAVRSAISRFYCGFSTEVDPASTRRWGLFAYGVASTTWRVLVTILMLWGLHHWLEPHGLAAIAQVLAIPTITFLVVAPLLTTARFLNSKENRGRIRWSRFFSRTVLTLAALAAVLSIPLPMRVSARALMDDGEAQRVYVTMAGTLIDAVPAGQTVEAGQIIGRLEEPGLAAVLTELEGKLALQKQRLANSELRRVSEPQLAAAIPSIRESVLDLERQLAQRQADSERLILRAPRAGVVLPPPQSESPPNTDSLPTWSGSPLDERNRRSYLKEGTVFCMIGEGHSLSATVVISQDDIGLVRAGQKVRLRWNELGREIGTGELESLAALEGVSLSSDERLRLELPMITNRFGQTATVGNWYRARVRLNQSSSRAPRGAAGEARIEVVPQSLGARLIRWTRQTFVP